jgi:WD40 repeat protein
VAEGVEVIRQAFDSIDRPIEVGSASISEQRFATYDEAREWCKLGATWHCQSDAKPWRELTEAPARMPGDPVAVFENLPAVPSLAFSPDGSRVVFAFFDGRESGVFLGDPAGGKIALAISLFPDPVNAVAYSPDGKLVAAAFGRWQGGKPGEARVWNAADGAERFQLAGHTSAVMSLAFSPDGLTLATGGSHGKILLFDAATGCLRMTLKGHERSVRCLSFSRDGSMLASGSEDNGIRIWDVPGGRELRRIDGHGSYVTGISFGPGRLLASSSLNKSVRIWNVEDGGEVLRENFRPTGFSVAFSPDGQVLAYGTMTDWASKEATLHLVDIGTKEPIGAVRWADRECNAIAFSPDGRRVAAALGDIMNNKDGAVRVWELDRSLGRGILARPGALRSTEVRRQSRCRAVGRNREWKLGGEGGLLGRHFMDSSSAAPRSPAFEFGYRSTSPCRTFRDFASCRVARKVLARHSRCAAASSSVWPSSLINTDSGTSSESAASLRSCRGPDSPIRLRAASDFSAAVVSG